MADIVLFEPRTALDAKTNLSDFIELCRTQIRPFGCDIAFDDNVWNISGCGTKVSNHGSEFLRFTSLKYSDTGSLKVSKKSGVVMEEPFLSFSKAMLSYMFGMNPTVTNKRRIAALRYLEIALRSQTGINCPTATTPQVLNFASQQMMDFLSENTAYDYSCELEAIYGYMIKLQLVTVPTSWRNIVPYGQNTHIRSRVGEKFDEERKKKLPSPAALTGLAQIFSSPNNTKKDTVVSSASALLICSPDRISEILHLPVNCIATERKISTGEFGCGLRWFPAKGASPMIKWVIPSMADIAKMAVDNLKRISEPARIVAKWYEDNPNKLYLPAHLEHLRSQEMLSMLDMGQLLFDRVNSRDTGVAMWVTSNKLAKVKLGGKKVFVRFDDVEKTIIEMLPRDFPIYDSEQNMLYSDALFIQRGNEIDDLRPTIQCLVEATTYKTIAKSLGRLKDRPNIFDRHRMTEEDGSPLSIRTHMFRHYLNTLAQQEGALSEEDIAMWSGRKNVSQNAVYNHVSDRDVLATLRKSVGNDKLAVGPLAHINNRVLVSRDEFANLKVVTAHTTEFGHCIHDYTMLPCQIHGDCLNCNEQVCVKGDAVRESNIRCLRDETRTLLKNAQAAMDEGDYGASNWVKHQSTTLERLDQLCELIDNPAIPIGSVIQPAGIVPASRLAQAAERRLAITGKSQIAQQIRTLDDAHALLLDQTSA